LILTNFEISVSLSIQVTCNWIATAQSALSALRRRKGWGTLSHVVFWSTTVAIVALTLYFSIAQSFTNFTGVFYLVIAVIMIVLLLFSLCSGVLVLFTINGIKSSNRMVLTRTTVQLVVLSFVVSSLSKSCFLSVSKRNCCAHCVSLQLQLSQLPEQYFHPVSGTGSLLCCRSCGNGWQCWR
jgi:hypothetical protein